MSNIVQCPATQHDRPPSSGAKAPPVSLYTDVAAATAAADDGNALLLGMLVLSLAQVDKHLTSVEPH